MSLVFRPGRYRHFKGGLYDALIVARHSETEEEFVVYRPADGKSGWWVRPRRLFCDTVQVNGTEQPRFAWLGPATTPAPEEAPP